MVSCAPGWVENFKQDFEEEVEIIISDCPLSFMSQEEERDVLQSMYQEGTKRNGKRCVELIDKAQDSGMTEEEKLEYKVCAQFTKDWVRVYLDELSILDTDN